MALVTGYWRMRVAAIISSPKDLPRCVTSNQLGSSTPYLLSASVLFALKLNKLLSGRTTGNRQTPPPVKCLWEDEGRKGGRAAWLWRHTNLALRLLYIISLLKVCYFTVDLSCWVRAFQSCSTVILQNSSLKLREWCSVGVCWLKENPVPTWLLLIRQIMTPVTVFQAPIAWYVPEPPL